MAGYYSPLYRKLFEEGGFRQRLETARGLLRSCALCPRRCGADRLNGQTGYCRTGPDLLVASIDPHFGEESVLVGRGGSGTVFLSGCTLRCAFCQNAAISQQDAGRVLSADMLAAGMVRLQRRGCHNINWVTPTHQLPQLLAALLLAAERGLQLPVVYNCSGYESVEALQLLDGIVDIYMPDAKYGSNGAGSRLSGVPDYWDRCQEALIEMHRQVGDLVVDSAGIAQRGLLVRHLVLPNDMADSQAVVRFLASLSPDTYINVMSQYQPAHEAKKLPAINRHVSRVEHNQVVTWALEAGLRRLTEGVG